MHFTRISTFIRINKTLKKGKRASGPKWPSLAQWREPAWPSGTSGRGLVILQKGPRVFTKSQLT